MMKCVVNKLERLTKEKERRDGERRKSEKRKTFHIFSLRPSWS
jgi:hypothetical protein